jgi:polysaccharide pyruvyl transferase WcaK-like protein
VKARSVALFADVGRQGKYHVGDEALLSGTLDWVGREFPGARVIVGSGSPRETAALNFCRTFRNPSGRVVSCLLNRGEGWRGCLRQPMRALGSLASVRHVRSAGLLHLCGGGYLTSKYPALVRLASLYARSAMAAGVPVLVSGVTIGPDIAPEEGAILRSWLPNVAYLSVRDAESVRAAEALGASCDACAFDEAWALDPENLDFFRLPSDRSRPLVGLCLHGESPKNSTAWLVAMACCLDAFADRHAVQFVFIPHMVQPVGGDVELGLRLKKQMRSDVYLIDEMSSARAAKWAAAQCEFVITTRYHGLVFSLASGVPAMALYQDDYTKAKLAGPWDAYRCSSSLTRLGSPCFHDELDLAWGGRHAQADELEQGRCHAEQALNRVRSGLQTHYAAALGADMLGGE